ncbi:MAG: hypothetical protein DLM55_06815 [Acidimicrobiales bacterium]|nr:MAG: hypothetical protein DLM55_06815 [Acidimicrobiales bacterium]
MFPSRRKAERAYWATTCPFDYQGQLEIWFSRRGIPILICDECATIWLDPSDVRAENGALTDPSARTLEFDDDVFSYHEKQPPSAEDIKRIGWWRFVHPLSIEVHQQ